MIAHLRGRVVRRGADHVVVDVQGVGYLVHVTASAAVPSPGEVVELHTSLQVREDSMTLYGFTDPSALTMFEQLLTSSGVGPRLAMAALGTLRVDDLRAAIATSDVAALTAVPGIGKKVAERLVLELRDRVGGVPELDSAAPSATGSPDRRVEVRQALLGLGYSESEVRTALAQSAGTDADTDADAADLLRAALRWLASDTAPADR